MEIEKPKLPDSQSLERTPEHPHPEQAVLNGGVEQVSIELPDLEAISTTVPLEPQTAAPEGGSVPVEKDEVSILEEKMRGDVSDLAAWLANRAD